MANWKTPYVWKDGGLMPSEEARIGLLTHSLHYGLGIFEGTRAYEQTGGGSAKAAWAMIEQHDIFVPIDLQFRQFPLYLQGVFMVIDTNQLHLTLRVSVRAQNPDTQPL